MNDWSSKLEGETSMILVGAITGATGVIYGIRLLQFLKKNTNVETHLIISNVGQEIILEETEMPLSSIRNLATYNYDVNDLSAPISSGSFPTDGMVIIPCTMKTLAGIACGYSENLILRAADVTLKEGRPLILVTRETPLSVIHLQNMLKLAKCGAVILPPMPAFYYKPRTVDDIVAYTVGKVLDLLKIKHSLYQPWKMPTKT